MGKMFGSEMDPTGAKHAHPANFAAHPDARLRKLVESSLVGIGCGDKNGLFTYANDKLLDLIGYTRDEFLHGVLRWDHMTPSEYHALDQAKMAEAVLQGHCTPYEKEFINKDGSRIPILIGFTWTGEQDQQFIGFILDLSAQKNAEAESHSREEKFRILAESLPQMIFTCDANGVKTYCCPRYLNYVGISRHEEMTAVWKDFIHPDDRQEASQAWTHSLVTGEPYTVEYRMRRHDGAYRYHVAKAVPMHNPEGEINGWVGSITDIHDTKQTEEVLRRTEKLAAAARIAASLAHEINNPLASVTNSLYLAMQDPNISNATRQYLRLADQELKRVAQVTTQTLRFHTQSTAPTSIDISVLVDSSLAGYARRLQACEIEVVRDYRSSHNLFCRADEVRQALGHLISNSIDAMTGGGKLHLRIRRTHAWDSIRTPGVRITIADNGEGIPADFLPHVFEAFSSTKDPTGTGLGMWVVEGVVRKHDGRIAIRSTTGAHRGTTISLFFPYLGVTDITS
jgi:PAS domain S-box-containing protein